MFPTLHLLAALNTGFRRAPMILQKTDVDKQKPS